MGMRIGIGLGTVTGGRRLSELGGELGDFEKAGAEVIFVPELYGLDAVSRLGYLAARTSTAHLASGILQLYTRTPTMLAMTAAGLDAVSDGRFELGIGTSGPQVIEGFHGVPFDAPIGTTRETIEICRRIWRREPLEFSGRRFTVPLPPETGTGLGKPLKMIDHPVRDRIPITIASIGPRNVELTAELAEGWQPPFFLPEKAGEVWGDALRAGEAKRDPALGPLDVHAGMSLAIGDDVHHLHDRERPGRALYIGGMGAREANFYNNLATWYGYGAEAQVIQDLYLAGKKKEAEAAVPEDLLVKTALIGSEGHVRDRLRALADCGVGTLTVRPMAGDHAGRVRLVEQLRSLIDAL